VLNNQTREGNGMVNVSKRDGRIEKLSLTKLKISLVRAGAPEITAMSVSRAVAANIREGVSTHEIKKRAAGELRKKDAPSARRYQSFNARNHANPATIEVAPIIEETQRYFAQRYFSEPRTREVDGLLRRSHLK
jgi:hypothetical protein